MCGSVKYIENFVKHIENLLEDACSKCIWSLLNMYKIMTTSYICISVKMYVSSLAC